MTTIKKLSAIVVLLSIPVVVTIYGECCEENRFRARPIHGAANWERSDGRCNLNSDCGPGQECDGFGFCRACS